MPVGQAVTATRWRRAAGASGAAGAAAGASFFTAGAASAPICSTPAALAGPAVPTTAASARITSCLSAPRSASSLTRSAVIRSAMSLSVGLGQLTDDDQVGAHVGGLRDGGAGQAGG